MPGFLISTKYISIAKWICAQLIEGLCIEMSKITAIFLSNPLFDFFDFYQINGLVCTKLSQAFHPQKLRRREMEGGLIVFLQQISPNLRAQLFEVSKQLGWVFRQLVMELCTLLNVFKFDLHECGD